MSLMDEIRLLEIAPSVTTEEIEALEARIHDLSLAEQTQARVAISVLRSRATSTAAGAYDDPAYQDTAGSSRRPRRENKRRQQRGAW